MTGMNHNAVVRSVPATSYEEAISLAEQAEQAYEAYEIQWDVDRPNSPAARRSFLHARHLRDLAAVSASLAVAEEIHELRLMLSAREQIR